VHEIPASDEPLADAIIALVWQWARTCRERWAGDPAALRVLDSAFAEMKRTVRELTGAPWFEADHMIEPPPRRRSANAT